MCMPEVLGHAHLAHDALELEGDFFLLLCDWVILTPFVTECCAWSSGDFRLGTSCKKQRDDQEPPFS